MRPVPAGPFGVTVASRPGELVQIDTTPLDVLAVLDDGVVGRVELTIALDLATRSICAAVLRPHGTKAVDASLLLARTLIPEPMRPGWSQALAMAHSRIPHARLLALDTRLEQAAAKPRRSSDEPRSRHPGLTRTRRPAGQPAVGE